MGPDKEVTCGERLNRMEALYSTTPETAIDQFQLIWSEPSDLQKLANVDYFKEEPRDSAYLKLAIENVILATADKPGIGTSSANLL